MYEENCGLQASMLETEREPFLPLSDSPAMIGPLSRALKARGPAG